MDILITGGAGAFGTAFINRILLDDTYERICIYSRDEAKHAKRRLNHQDNEKLRYFVGDVRDLPRLKRAMQGIDIVIHAAALKRIEVGAYDPEEMVKTNVLGSMNVIEAAVETKVKKVIYLSTDKAYQPISPYGHSKALAEQLFRVANFNQGNGPQFSTTRYGNVAHSTGSVIPTWKEIGNDATMTNPDCTRFYMTMEQAVDLVLKTIEEMPINPVIPHLPAFKLGDLAEAMGLYPLVKGLPDHEKLHECMEDGNCSNTARRMTIEELKLAISSN